MAGFPSPADHFEELGSSYRPTAFGVEDVAALQILPPQLALWPDLLTGERVRAIDAVLGPPSLVTVTSPPIMRASLRVMASPRPVPPLPWAVDESACVSRAHASAPANTIWPLRAFTPALMPSASLFRVGGSLQTVVKMFTDVLRTFACCVSCWRGDQQGGQYDHAKHKRALALRYRHFSLPHNLPRPRA